MMLISLHDQTNEEYVGLNGLKFVSLSNKAIKICAKLGMPIAGCRVVVWLYVESNHCEYSIHSVLTHKQVLRFLL